MQRTYDTQTYNAAKAFLYFFPVFTGTAAGILWIGNSVFNSLAMMIIGWIAVCIFPFLFAARIKRIFTRKIVLTFDDQSLSIVERSLKDDVKLYDVDVQWSRIAAYKFSLAPSNTTYLTLYMRDGGKKNYSFRNKETPENAVGADSIVGVFRSFVKEYNDKQSPEKQVVLYPGFLTTRVGTTLLYGLVSLAICALALSYYTRSKGSIGLLIMSMSMLLGLLNKRSNDRSLYNQLKNI